MRLARSRVVCSSPLRYRSSLRLVLTGRMGSRRGRGEKLAIVRPAIRLPREAEGLVSGPSSPGTGLPTKGEEGEAPGKGEVEGEGRKVPKSVASMVRR